MSCWVNGAVTLCSGTATATRSTVACVTIFSTAVPAPMTSTVATAPTRASTAKPTCHANDPSRTPQPRPGSWNAHEPRLSPSAAWSLVAVPVAMPSPPDPIHGQLGLLLAVVMQDAAFTVNRSGGSCMNIGTVPRGASTWRSAVMSGGGPRPTTVKSEPVYPPSIRSMPW